MPQMSRLRIHNKPYVCFFTKRENVACEAHFKSLTANSEKRQNCVYTNCDIHTCEAREKEREREQAVN